MSDRGKTTLGARDRFLAGGGVDVLVRPEVRASWERCRNLGLDPGVLAPPHRADLELDTQLVRAAHPVLDRLAERLDLTPTAVLLADAGGGILCRWVGDPGLHRALERVSAVPGSILAEGAVGTNGLGTPLVQGAPVVISGPEHLKDGYLDFCCAGAPVRDPRSAALLGAVTITCRAADRNALLVPLLIETVEHIERRLGERTTPPLGGFHRGTGRGRRTPHAGLPAPVPPVRLAPAAGTSAAWTTVAVEVRRQVASRLPVLVGGEPGVGKIHLLRLAWAAEAGPADGAASSLRVLDVARLAVDGRRAVLQRVGTALRSGPVLVVLRHAELCDAPTARGFAALLDEREGDPSAPLVAATVITDRDGPGLHPALRDRLGALPVEVPPLRRRPEDIDALVSWFTGEHGGPDHRWTEAAKAALRRHSWPGNTRELRNVVLGVLARHRGDIDVPDLPPSFDRDPAGPLTALQRLEREAIAEGISMAGGNKALAAERLGISRSTLYRKLREYRMTGTVPGPGHR